MMLTGIAELHMECAFGTSYYQSRAVLPDENWQYLLFVDRRHALKPTNKMKDIH